MLKARTDGPAARWFAQFTARIYSAVPTPLRRIIPPTFIGYALINGGTFALDMLLLSLFHGSAQIPYPVAVTLGYTLATMVSFVVNRWLNFREHGDLGVQSTKYVAVVVSNYVIWILGFSWLLEWAGVQYQISRFVAAVIEGLYIYTLMRLWVFPLRHQRVRVTDQDEPGESVDGFPG